MRCYWDRDAEIGRFYVPGCMGAAVYGPRGCTCGSKGSRRALEEENDRLKERIRKLEQIPRMRAASVEPPSSDGQQPSEER